MDKIRICERCNKEYKDFMFENFNLNLCSECLDVDDIECDEMCDEVTHTVTCPLCGQVYGFEIADNKCKTEGCPVYFFINTLDGHIMARWRKQLEGEK